MYIKKFNLIIIFQANAWTVNIGVRNLIDYGQNVSNPLFQLVDYDYADLVTKDEGYVNLTKKWADGTSYVVYSNIETHNVVSYWFTYKCTVIGINLTITIDIHKS